MDLRQEMLRNCIPAIICTVLNGIYTIIDGFFIGQSVGENGLAAINLVWPVPAVITAAGTAIGTGGGICLSLERGKKKRQQTGIIFQNTFVLFGTASLFLTAALSAGLKKILVLLGAGQGTEVLAQEYGVVIAAFAAVQILGSGIIPLLRNAGKPVTAMCCMICGMLVNICLNYFFIFVQNMGISGAAWGTVGAQLVVAFLGLLFFFFLGRRNGREKTAVKRREDVSKKNVLSFRVMLRWSKRILYNGGAVFGITLLPTWILALTNYQCMRLCGTAVVAIYAVISYLVFPIQNILVGIADGIQPLVSLYAGKKDTESISRLIKLADRSVAVLALLFLCLVFASAPVTGYFFGLAQEHMADYVWGLRAAAISFLPYGLSRLKITCMNGRGQSKKAAILVYGETLVIAPAALIMLPIFLGIKGIWIEPLAVAGICQLLTYKMEDFAFPV